MTIILYLLPVQISSFNQSDSMSTFWYIITITGSPAGFIAVVFLMLLIMFIETKSLKFFNKKVFVFFASVILIQIALTAGLQLMKSCFKIQRPYQQILIKNGLGENERTLLQSIPEDKKSDFIENNINKNKLNHINSLILESWLSEKAYSFPSGHSQTSFFAAILLSFVILVKAPGYKYLAVIPVIWCILVSISRVLAGFHFPSDVMAGAFIGLATGLIIVSYDKFVSLIN